MLFFPSESWAMSSLLIRTESWSVLSTEGKYKLSCFSIQKGDSVRTYYNVYVLTKKKEWILLIKIEGPCGKREHVPFWILNFPKNGKANYRHMNNIICDLWKPIQIAHWKL